MFFMPDFSDTVLITDLDGTLLPQSKIVDPVDLRAIERFKSCGGTFTVATGRIYQAAEQFFDVLKPNAPVIMNNGGLIYDIQKKENLYALFLDRAAEDYTRILMEKFPDMGVEINTADKIYVAKMTKWEKVHLSLTHLKYEERSIEDIPTGRWCKVLYSFGDGKVRELAEFAAEMGWNKTGFVVSGDFLFECLPKGSTKGSALKILSEKCGWGSLTVAAAGDYDNDLEMIEFADVGIAPQNARDIVKSSAEYVTAASCEEGAIAEAIEYLEKRDTDK